VGIYRSQKNNRADGKLGWQHVLEVAGLDARDLIA